MSDRPVRWAIIGPGGIARKFAAALPAVAGARLVAVASRDCGRARIFARENNAERSTDSVAAVAEARDIDAVYVATPHPFHCAPALACLAAGKAVLVEKPLALNAAQVESLVAASRQHQAFLMEAMWTRFLPAWRTVAEWIAAGRIGEPRLVSADFGFRCGWDPHSRLLNRDLAGGALLDVGVYTLAAANSIFPGPPLGIAGFAHLGATGVDEQSVAVLSWPSGQLARLAAAVRTVTAGDCRIDGTEASIHLPQFWRATRAILTRGDQTETIDGPHERNGFEYQIREVHRCLADGLIESPVMPQGDSLTIAGIMDALRRQWGLRYPGEDGAASS